MNMLTPTSLTGQSVALREIEDEATTIAARDIRVLITGEQGVGKQTVARLVHERSQRADRPFVTIDCGSNPASTVEPDWLQRHIIASHDGGTILIRGIDNMSADQQAALNQYLDDVYAGGTWDRSGHADVARLRVLATARRSLFDAVETGTFRRDLFYRLNTVHIAVPPLRERFEDVPVLFEHFVQEAADVRQCAPPRVMPEILHALMAYAWPENVRELKLVAKRFVMRSGDGAAASPLLLQEDQPDRLRAKRPLRSSPADIGSLGRPQPHIAARPRSG